MAIASVEVSDKNRGSLRLLKAFCRENKLDLPAFDLTPQTAEAEAAKANSVLAALRLAGLPFSDVAKIAHIIGCILKAAELVLEKDGHVAIEKAKQQNIKVLEMHTCRQK